MSFMIQRLFFDMLRDILDVTIYTQDIHKQSNFQITTLNTRLNSQFQFFNNNYVIPFGLKTLAQTRLGKHFLLFCLSNAIQKKTLAFMGCKKGRAKLMNGPQKDKENFFIAKAICCKKLFFVSMCVQYYSGSKYEKAKYLKVS